MIADHPDMEQGTADALEVNERPSTMHPLEWTVLRLTKSPGHARAYREVLTAERPATGPGEVTALLATAEKMRTRELRAYQRLMETTAGKLKAARAAFEWASEHQEALIGLYESPSLLVDRRADAEPDCYANAPATVGDLSDGANWTQTMTTADPMEPADDDAAAG